MLEDDCADNQRGIVSTNSINLDSFKEFNRNFFFLKYANQSLETLKQLPKEHLFDLQKAYCKMMLEKETEFLFNYSQCDRDEIVAYESWKRGVDNSFQFNRIMKSSKPSSPTVPKLLNGTAYPKQKGYFEQVSIDIEQVSIDIGTRNNYPKSNLPTLTIF